MNKIIYLLIILSLAFSSSQERSLSYKDGGTSCSTIVVVDAEGTEIELPLSVTKALDCGYASLSPNSDYLAYFQDDALNMYDFAEQGWIHFSDIPTHPDGIDSSVFWSEDASRLGIVHISQSGIFEHNSQVRFFELDGIKILDELVLDIEVTFSCGGSCSPIDIAFEGNDVLRYQTNSSMFYMDGLRTIARIELVSQ